MTWHTKALAGFDVESTGVDYETDRIVTAAVIADNGAGEITHTTWLIDPGVDIPEAASAVHGITTEHARAHGRKAPEALEDVAVSLAGHLNAGVPLVAMNAKFDLTMLDRNLRLHGLVPLVDRQADGAVWAVIDPMVIDKQADRYRKGKRTLSALSALYGVELGEDAHDAAADAVAAVGVARALGARYGQLAVEPALLHAWQVRWAAGQAASLQDYFRTRGGRPDEVVEGAWPLVPFAGTGVAS